jgi:hypothetical protein
VAASCRKYLDAIAAKLAFFYDFETEYSNPTMGDVLKARDTDEGQLWSFRVSTRSRRFQDDNGYTRTLPKGTPYIDTPLPSLFTDPEWQMIRDFNKDISGKIHDARIPEDSKGNPYIVIPHSKFTPERINFLKMIGFKSKLFSDPDDLRVKDEDVESVDTIASH